MRSSARTVGAVLAGAVVWALLWVGGTSALRAMLPDVLSAARVEHVGVLAALVVYSVGLSLLAGYTTARLSVTGAAMRNTAWLAGVQFVLGVIAETAAWQATPVWYHVVFLALLVPATLLGGRLAVSGWQHVPAPRAAG
jgi:hypothetical protein